MIGHPIAQVKSLAPINAFFLCKGLDACMIPIDLAPSRVGSFFDHVRGWSNCVGVSITLPHKQAAAAACDALSPRARMARAANVIRRDAEGRLYGDMTDGVAFCAALRRRGVTIRGASFLLIGAGGAGAAVAHAMAEAEAARLAVVDIDAERRAGLMQSLRACWPAAEVVEADEPSFAADIVLNATPLGMMDGDPLPIDLTSIPRAALVADAVTAPAVTSFLAQARFRGHNIQTGTEMALAQLPVQLPFWGFEPPE